MSIADLDDWTVDAQQVTDNSDLNDWTVAEEGLGGNNGTNTGGGSGNFTTFSTAASVGTATTVTCNIPTLSQVGALFLATVMQIWATATITTPAGWTLIGGVADGANVCGQIQMYLHTVTNSEPASYTWSSTQDDLGVCIRQYINVTGADGGVATANINTTANFVTPAYNSLVAATAGEVWAIAFQTVYVNSPFGAPAGFGNVIPAQSGGVVMGGYADAKVTVAGNTGTAQGSAAARGFITTSVLLK